MMTDIKLFIEPTDSGYMGSVKYEDNLIVDYSSSIKFLEDQLKRLLFEFHNVTPADISFTVVDNFEELHNIYF